MRRSIVMRDGLRELRESLAWILAIFLLINVFGGVYYLRIDFVRGLGFLLGVLLGFIFHELAHRSVARRLACTSRFTIDLTSVLFTSSIALIQNIMLMFTGRGLPFIIALPGYVMSFCGFLPRSGEGLIAFAGPLTNIMISILSMLIATLISSPRELVYILEAIYRVNVLLALFNLIPIPPLDGFKIARWNLLIWFLLIMIGLALLML
ncbi:MAG: site-2 protease family protein [Sulfolobales archaeon]